MDGLLGGPDHRRAFADFLYDADQLSLNRYAVEALFPASIAAHANSDPQEQQFSNVVRRLMDAQPGKVRLLDYAAGRGRFAVALADALPPNLRDRVEYHAYNDPRHDRHREECVRSVATLRTHSSRCRS